MASKNSIFNWEGINREGKSVNGQIEARNADLAKAQLRRQGINANKIRKKSSLNFKIGGGRIKSKDITAFSRQLSTMVNAGVPLVQSLNIVIKSSSNPKYQELITNINNDVQSGTKLRDALAKYPKYFNNLFCSLVGVGEESGTLATMLDRIASYEEKSQSLKKKIKKALMYPTVIIIVAFIVSAVLLLKVVPQFQSLFASFNAKLPAFTLFVIQLSKGFTEYWLEVIIIIIAVIAGIIVAKRRSKKFAYSLDIFTLHLPIFGLLIRKGIIARFARTLATTFSAGMPLVESLKIVAQSSDNRLYEDKILEIRDAVSTGRSLNVCLEASKLFPVAVVQMVAIGEETGEIDKMLNKIAEIYEEEVDAMVDGLSSLIEPLIIGIIGLLVGGLVIAMYMPIFQLGSVV